MAEPSSNESAVQNVWLRETLEENPYARTAFHVARVARETIRRGAIVQAVAQTRQLVSADPQSHCLGGEPVTPGEVNKAEGILLDAPRRITEELLHHATERYPSGPIRSAAQQLAAHPPELPQEDSAESTPTALRFPPALAQAWAAHLTAVWLAEIDGGGSDFGARELEIVPPFYHPDQDSRNG